MLISGNSCGIIQNKAPRHQQASAGKESISYMQGGFGLPRISLVPASRIRYPPAFGLHFQVTLLVGQREK
jgi:hypothetical protein